jgi:hypothetical protein
VLLLLFFPAKKLQDSKMGHALLRKVKVLTEENEDLGRQQRESKQAAQVRADKGKKDPDSQQHCCHTQSHVCFPPLRAQCFDAQQMPCFCMLLPAAFCRAHLVLLCPLLLLLLPTGVCCVLCAQGAIAAVERRHADELREELQDTRDLCTFYQQENEELNMVSLLYQRQLETLKQRAAAAPAPGEGRAV